MATSIAICSGKGGVGKSNITVNLAMVYQSMGKKVAIFDADFLPNSDWLLKTVPHFTDPKTGVVQTRWGHLNRSHSILTEVQAFALDAHFLLEQVGRNQQQHFINFNGTAGIWRKS